MIIHILRAKFLVQEGTNKNISVWQARSRTYILKDARGGKIMI